FGLARDAVDVVDQLLDLGQVLVDLGRKRASQQRRQPGRLQPMAQADERCSPADLLDEAGVHLLLYPGPVNRGRCEQGDEMRAIADALVDLAAQAVSRLDLPFRPPCRYAMPLQGVGNTS